LRSYKSSVLRGQDSYGVKLLLAKRWTLQPGALQSFGTTVQVG
jgi:hypothetical protein